MFKKILAGVVTAVLSLGVVALVAGPASAHHSTIWPEVTCATNGTYNISWSVENSESNKTELIQSSTPAGVIPANTTLGFSEKKYFPQNVAAPQNITLTVNGFWDGDTSTNKDDVYNSTSFTLTADKFPTGCLTVTPSVTPNPSVCDGPNHFTAPTYTLGAVTGVKYTVNGAVQAPGTYPATNGGPAVHIEASVTDSKYKITGQTVWDLTFTEPADTCTVQVDPVTPDIAQQICTGPGQHKLATYTIPNKTGVLYSVKINGVETDQAPGTYEVPDGVTAVQIIARGDTANYYVLTGGTKIYDFTFNDAGKCLVEKKPKTPTVITGQCDATKPGVVPVQSYTLYDVDNVIYQVSTNGGPFEDRSLNGDTTYTVKQGDSIVVRAVADDATKYQVTFAEFSYSWATVGDCKVELTPIEPSGEDQFCDETDVNNPVLVDGTITLTPVDHIQYFIDGVPQASGVAITVTPGSHTVTAAIVDADKGAYKIKDGAVTSWPIEIGGDICLPTEGIVIPAVTSTQVGCFSSGSYTLSNDQNDASAVIWTVNGSQVASGKYTVSGTGTLTITAAPNAPAWGFDVGQQTSWTINFAKPSVCDTETLALTGQSPVGLLVAADLLVVAGLVMFAMRAVRRGRVEA